MDLVLSPNKRRVEGVEALLERFLGDPAETGTDYVEYAPQTSPDRLEPQDLAYTLLMNSNVTGKTFRAVQQKADSVTHMLAALPKDVPLEDSTQALRDDVTDLLCAVASWPHLKVSVATKLLHKKRPRTDPRP